MKTKEINVLPPSIFNLLAAGEVVENPASIVKEAVENSLDAGATEIEISIEDGGFAEIRVTDNGAGCDASQIEKVFLPHATSKIASARDLEKILTLGFRGEALSSIASVSKVEFTSRTAGAEVATRVTLDAGKVIGRSSVGSNLGTELVVRNLFYNVPARRKFLKTMKAEENNVAAVVQKLILANPEVGFRYLADGEVVYSHQGWIASSQAPRNDALLSAIEVIYGKDVASKLIPVNVNRGGLTLVGFVSRTDFSKKNRTWQTVMVNGRAVDGGTVGAAANDAYSNYLMTGNFPFFVLDLRIDERAVDVNVHPRKLQVRFEDERGVYEFVKVAVGESIDKCFSTSLQVALQYPCVSNNHHSTEIPRPVGSEGLGMTVKSAENVLTFLEKAGKFELGKEQKKIVEAKHEKVNPYYHKRSLGQDYHKRSLGQGLASDNPYERKRVKDAVQEEMKPPEIFDGKILGTVLDTYVLVQSSESLFIIDQHAAHERLLYDELTKQIDAGEVLMQPLLEPAVLGLSTAEMARVLEILPILNQMGIECEVFGKSSFRITAVPMAVSVRGIDTILSNVLASVKGAAPSKLSEIIREKIITECCRSAIKAGHHLTQGQIGGFLSQIKGLKVPLCPHGRPVVVALDKKMIEKMFRRI